MLRIGLLGASRIAVPAIVEPARTIAGVEVTEVAARDPVRAMAYAERHKIAVAQPDYTAVIASADVDLVYNGLPPSEHAALTIAALNSGKHVLCEKPFAMNAAEASAMADAAARNGRVLVEAFHYRFHPLFVRLMELLQAGSIGNVEAVAAHFSVPIHDSPSEFRYRKDMGGGALMDLGCYAVHWARTIVGTEPKVIAADRQLHSTGVDVETTATLEFPDGQMARVSCAMFEDLDEFDSHLSIVGSRGRIDVKNPGAPHTGKKLTLSNDEGSQSEEFSSETTFYHQLKHVHALIEGREEALLPPLDAVNNMRVLDAIVAMSASSG